jgi:molybdopterin-guanine dinucleotide biosynthesis protein B
MKPVVIGVVGAKKSGKTTAIEVLIKELTGRGYRIAAVKHIPEPDFTIDREGKDTWRYAQAGARTVIGVSADEVATIEKVHIREFSLKEILARCRESDVVFLEGFRKLAADSNEIYKILIAKSAEDAEEAARIFEPVLAFTGHFSTEKLNLKPPYVELFEHAERLADLIEELVKKKRQPTVY